jgi:hypothetical protein
VRFERDSWVRRMIGHDYEVGVSAFDKRVRVLPTAGDLGGGPELRALEDEGVRQAILELLDWPAAAAASSSRGASSASWSARARREPRRASESWSS